MEDLVPGFEPVPRPPKCPPMNRHIGVIGPLIEVCWVAWVGCLGFKALHWMAWALDRHLGRREVLWPLLPGCAVPAGP